MNANQSKDTNINIRLSSLLKAGLVAAAESEHLTLSDFVIAVFEQHLNGDTAPPDQHLQTELAQANTVLHTVKQQCATAQAQVAAYEGLALPLAALIGKTYTHNGKTLTITTAFDVLQAVSLHINLSLKP
jgi:hypothetical protein